MENPKAQKLLNKMQRDLMRNGIILNTIVEDFKELRPFAVEENNPLLAKVIRLTYEHIETYGTFDIPIPEDEPVEGFEEETASAEDTDVKTAYQLGANSYVIKPVQFDSFMEAMVKIGLYWLMVNHPLK